MGDRSYRQLIARRRYVAARNGGEHKGERSEPIEEKSNIILWSTVYDRTRTHKNQCRRHN